MNRININQGLNMEKVSIVTICYNNSKDIRATVESVLSQSYNNIEYIIVDGKSRDNTLEIVSEYSDRISKIISEPDKNLYDAINKGIRLSTGDIVGLIHAGDRLFDNQIVEKIASHFTENEIDAMYGNSIIVNSNDLPVRVNKSPEFNKKLFEVGWMPSHQSIYIRRDKLDMKNLYRLDLGGSADYEFVLRHFYFGSLKVKKLDEFVIRFAIGGRSTKFLNYFKLFKVQKVHIKCWKLNGKTPPFYMVPLKLLRKVKQFALALYYNVTGKFKPVRGF